MVNYPPFGWPGGSMVVDYDGRILAQADPGPGEKVVVAPINVTALREERERRAGHDMRGHLRSKIHPYMSQDYLTAAGPDISIETNHARIKSAKRELE